MMKQVCLDPGHGIETAGKRSPDGSYRECEFALDMAFRIKALLERHGVAVTLTRSDEHDVSLAQRAKTANAIDGLDLFVSLHSNAAGSGAAWMSARGLLVYTSGGAADAPRNRAALAILARQAEAGVTVRNSGQPVAQNLYVLRNTTAPACLVEHLFHDNLEDVALLKDDGYRQKMARADAKGILDYLGLAWVDENEKEETGMDKNAPDDWAKEAWDKARAAGVLDGTRPRDNVTRQELAVVLARLGLSPQEGALDPYGGKAADGSAAEGGA